MILPEKNAFVLLIVKFDDESGCGYLHPSNFGFGILEPRVARCYVLQSASFWELIPNNGEVTKIRLLEYAVESLACSCIVVLQAKTGLILIRT